MVERARSTLSPMNLTEYNLTLDIGKYQNQLLGLTLISLLLNQSVTYFLDSINVDFHVNFENIISPQILWITSAAPSCFQLTSQ